MSGNGMRTLAWVAARDGLGADGTLTVDTGGGRREVELTRDPTTGEVTTATVDMGPVTFDPAHIPIAVDSPFGITADYHGTRYEGDAAGMGNPHLVLFVDDPGTAPRHPARSAPRARRPLPAAHQRRVRARRRPARPTSSTCACGSAAWARPSAAAPAPARSPRSPTAAGWWGARDRARSRRRPRRRAGRHHPPRRSGGARLRRGAGAVSRRRLTATEVDLAVLRQRALLVGTGIGDARRRSRRSVARGAGAPRRHRGCRAGRARPATPRQARPRDLHRFGQGERAAGDRRRARHRSRDLRRRAHAGAATQPRAPVQGRRRRSRRADPRHLRPARAQPGRHGAGRARATALPPAAAAGEGQAAQPAGRRWWRTRRARRYPRPG